MIEVHARFRVQESLVSSGKVVFVFTALGTKISTYRLFVRALNKCGYSVIIYDYPISLMVRAQLDEWHGFYKDIVNDAQARIQRLSGEGVSSFSAHGTSMGTLVAGLLGRTTPQISHTVLNLTYGDLARNIYTSKPPRRAKEKFVKQGITEAMLAKEFSYIDPVKTAAEFKDKKVLLYLSKPDSILDYNDSLRTKKALEQTGALLTYYENKRLGHFLGGAKNISGIKKLIAFLES
ncbi:MAG: hypothetical protein JWO47_877 [Candidatus Saccharibacteria bacterium]|nr:hypothetical protein [Candidatus Saccharibacteria bacterium]